MKTVDGYNHYGQPRTEVVRALKQICIGEACILDIGAGLGNNLAVVLEHAGRIVTTETSPECLCYLERAREQHPERIEVRNESVADLSLTSRFDLVACTMVLHFVSADLGPGALIRIKSAVKPGGLCVVTSYLQQPGLSEEYTWLLAPEELRTAFAGWEITYYAESYPFVLQRARTARELLRWLRGARGFRAARIIARRPQADA